MSQFPEKAGSQFSPCPSTSPRRRAGSPTACIASCGRWLQPTPSFAGLHLAARIDAGADARRLVDALHRPAPGAQSAAEYAMPPEAAPMVVFGYGVIDAQAIRPALARALSR